MLNGLYVGRYMFALKTKFKTNCNYYINTNALLAIIQLNFSYRIIIRLTTIYHRYYYKQY